MILHLCMQLILLQTWHMSRHHCNSCKMQVGFITPFDLLCIVWMVNIQLWQMLVSILNIIYIWFSTCCALISIDRNYLWMLMRGSHRGSNYCRVPCHTNFLQEEWPRSSGSESALVPDPLGHKRVDDEVYFSCIVEIRWTITSTWITGLSFFRGSFCGRSKIGNSYAKKDIEDWQPRRGRPMAEPYDHKPSRIIHNLGLLSFLIGFVTLWWHVQSLGANFPSESGQRNGCDDLRPFFSILGIAG